jgi:hypothetical protein
MPKKTRDNVLFELVSYIYIFNGVYRKVQWSDIVKEKFHIEVMEYYRIFS